MIAERLFWSSVAMLVFFTARCVFSAVRAAMSGDVRQRAKHVDHASVHAIFVVFSLLSLIGAAVARA